MLKLWIEWVVPVHNAFIYYKDFDGFKTNFVSGLTLLPVDFLLSFGKFYECVNKFWCTMSARFNYSKQKWLLLEDKVPLAIIEFS